MVEIVGFDKKLCVVCCEMLEMCVNDLFLGGGDMLKVMFWMGLCLMMLDGMLIVGCMLVLNLFLNIGYGMFGWMMLCGLG